MTTLLRNAFFLSFLLILLHFGCKKRREFPPVKDVAVLSQTVVLPTLEHPLPKGKNAVYAASLLFAWDMLRKELGGSIAVNDKLKDLALLNKSKSYLGSLREDEVEKSAVHEGRMVKVSANFEESLPFEYEFERFPNKLKFANQKVPIFGLFGKSGRALSSLDILYYKSDDHFAVRLLPKDTTHEILLYMFPSAEQPNLRTIFDQFAADKEKGSRERKTPKKTWRYEFNETDELAVPVISFNVESYFPAMTKNGFEANGQQFFIEEINQRTAFILDEKGAEVESEAFVEVTEAPSMDEEVETPKPKHLVFDKPFFVALKMKGSKWPYFAAFIENPELLQTN